MAPAIRIPAPLIQMLYHLLYLSSAIERFDDAALAALLELARRNNAAVGVTGMLLYADGNFIQYLEGEADAVRGVFAKITRDPRHDGILTVTEGPVEQRVFADWSMGFHTMTPQEHKLLGQIDLNRAVLEEKIDPEAPVVLKVMMRNFYEGTHRHKAS